MVRESNDWRERIPLRGNHRLNGPGHVNRGCRGVQHRDGMTIAALGNLLAMPGAIAAATRLQRGTGETQAGKQQQHESEMGNCA